MPEAKNESHFDISVVISTYNRCGLLSKTIASLLAQEAEGTSFEILVVDNNSTDGTRGVVQSFIDSGGVNLRYLFEPKQGVSYGRNAGIEASRAPIIAFTDDDVHPAKNWIVTIKRVLNEQPDVDLIGGKALPAPGTSFPRWLSRDHWHPIAILDYGDNPFYINSDNRLCLLTGNMAIRRECLDSVGVFSPTLQRVKDGIGSMEDLELQLRIWSAGKKALYVPELLVFTEVPATRLTKSYHRRWNKGNGHFYASLHAQEIERSERGYLLDVPAHLYRQALIDAVRWVGNSVCLRADNAFNYETKLCFFAGFFSKRRRDFLDRRSHSTIREIARFVLNSRTHDEDGSRKDVWS